MTQRRRARRVGKIAAFLESASLTVLASTVPALAQQAGEPLAVQAQDQVAEQVLITGSLIHGAADVGVPVTTYGATDFKNTGAVTTTDIFKYNPIANVPSFQSSTDGGNTIERTQSVNIRGLSSKGPRTLLLIDGYRFPSQGDSGCQIDPSIIPSLALSRVDLLADGASATYGSDAIAGVVNVILRRGFDGAITEGSFGFSPEIGHDLYRGSALFGRTWDSGDITVTYEYYMQKYVSGTARPYYTENFNATNGVDNRTPLANSLPGEVSAGPPAFPAGYPFPVTNKNVTVPGSPGSFSPSTGTSCGNCYAIPAGQNGQGLTWAQIIANPGTSNERNPYADAWEEPNQARSALVVTADQNVLPGIQAFADAFYDNRRSIIHNVGTPSSSYPGTNNASAFAIPTVNPYYPAGAPNNLVVNYELNYEQPAITAGNELASRYDVGFNIALPGGWTGKIYAVDSDDKEVAVSTGLINLFAASAALGWTVPANAVLASYTKPANVPYLNLFCDPTRFTCNNAATLAYIDAFSDFFEENQIHEFGATGDGTVVSLPGGDLKAAIGVDYYHLAYFDESSANYTTGSPVNIATATETARRQVYAGFAQVNVPIIGDMNQLPLIQRLEVEASVRYDHYNAFGGTTNPKVAGDWLVVDGLKLSADWGTSFRAPTFQESGAVSGTLDQPVNPPALVSASQTYGTCLQVGKPAVAGSIAAIIDPNCTQALQFLGGIRLANGAGIAAGIRPGGSGLSPEKAQNVSAGFDFAPTDPFLKGLDLQATYYFVKIRNKLQGCPITPSQLDNPDFTFCYTIANGDPNFQAQVLALMQNPRSSFNGTATATNIAWIADGAIRNIGWQSTNGVDFEGSYNVDLDEFGSWNAGVTGTYIIDNYSVSGPGQPIISVYSTVQSGTKNSGGRDPYRAWLGWAGGPNDAWSITGFMNFIPHFNTNGGSLPPLCFLQGNTPCNAAGLTQFSEYNQQYPTLSNYIPGIYTFDLAITYMTGDVPANRYLKNISVTLSIKDLLNKAPPYQYSIATNSNTPHPFYNALSADQRYFTLFVTKSW